MSLDVRAIFTNVVDVWDSLFINFWNALINVFLDTVVVHLNLWLKTNLRKLLPRPQSWLISVKALSLVFVLLKIKWVQAFLNCCGRIETWFPDVVGLNNTWAFRIWKQLLVGYGGIFVRMIIIVSNRTLMLIVPSRSWHAPSSMSSIGFWTADLVTIGRVCWVVDWDCWVLSVSMWFWTLSRLVSGEAEHISQVFTELSCSWKASSSDITRETIATFNVRNPRRSCSWISDHITLWIVCTCMTIVS